MHASACVIGYLFKDPATTEIYTLSLHDALPIFHRPNSRGGGLTWRLVPIVCSHSTQRTGQPIGAIGSLGRDRKSTRLNSSHGYISYAVFCLKKKKTNGGSSSPGWPGRSSLPSAA